MNLPVYDDCKESESGWLGEVPRHWKVAPLKHIAEFINGAAFKPTEWAEAGYPIVRIENLNGVENFNYFSGVPEARYLVHEGDLLFGWSGNRGTSFGPFLWSRTEVCVLNQHIFRVESNEMSKRELFWTLKAVTAHVEEQAHGIIGMVHITKGNLGSIQVPVPPPGEQKAIASFLDAETAKIDALVAEQRRLIELLKEKRQAVISHAVTKGLNSDAPMKPSGVSWIGDVPEHWSVSSLRHFATFCTGSTPDRGNPSYWNGSIPWVKTGEIKYSLITETEETISREGLDSSSCSIALPGTLLMALYGQGITRGRVAILGIPAAFNQACVAITVGPRLLNDFLQTFFIFAYPSIRNMGNETTQMNLNVEFVRRIHVAVPPLVEQLAIVKQMQIEIAEFDALIAEAEYAIELLQERRTALISAAVTGKIDVREFAYRETA